MNEDHRSLREEEEAGFSAEKRLALEDIKPWIEVLSEEELDRPFLIVGPRAFSPRQILKEIKASTEDGRYIVRMLTDQRLEAAEREEEVNER